MATELIFINNGTQLRKHLYKVAKFLRNKLNLNIEIRWGGVDYLQGYHLHQPSQWDSVRETFGFKGVENA